MHVFIYLNPREKVGRKTHAPRITIHVFMYYTFRHYLSVRGPRPTRANTYILPYQESS